MFLLFALERLYLTRGTMCPRSKGTHQECININLVAMIHSRVINSRFFIEIHFFDFCKYWRLRSNPCFSEMKIPKVEKFIRKRLFVLGHDVSWSACRENDVFLYHWWFWESYSAMRNVVSNATLWQKYGSSSFSGGTKRSLMKITLINFKYSALTSNFCGIRVFEFSGFIV